MDSKNSLPQQPGTSAASNTNTSPNNKATTTLLSDPTFQAVHNALLLGWSLMELKSRVQITASTLSLDPGVVINILNQPTSTQPDSQSPSQTDQKNLPALTQDNSLAQSQDDQHNPPDSIDSLLENVVLKDVIALKDVKNQQAQSNRPTSQEKSLSTELRDNVWLTSVLRAIFMQIATLHVKRFPNSDVTNTIYNIHPPSELPSHPQPDPQPPPDAVNKQPTTDQENNKNGQKASDQQKVQEAFPYPYLYPADAKLDYANVGIKIIKQDNVWNNNIDIDSFVKNFRLYDVTRRALNCLTLLLTTPQDSLLPKTIADYQQELIQQILVTSPASTESDSSNQKPGTQQAETGSNTGQLSNNKIDQDNKKIEAIKKLSNLTIPLLEAWDSFLRESFYVDTNSLNNDPQLRNYEIELVAYEAGRSLAALSWGVSVALVPLEKLSLPAQQENGNVQNAHIRKILNKKAQDTWRNVFNDRDINHVQHQIAALSTALDEAYYRINTAVNQPGPDDPLAALNPDLPSQAIQAVKHSLDYWERAITRICEEKKPLATPMPAKTQPQNGTADNQLVDRTPRPSRPLDWDTSKTLRTELIQQSTVWQSLILGQQGLRSFTVETVTQKILNDFMQDFEEAARKEIFNNGAFKWTLGIIIGIILALIGLIGLGILIARPSASALMSIISSPLVITTTIVTAIGAIATPFVNGFLSKLSKIGSFFGSAGTALEKALQDGYAQILIEFGYLNHNIGVTFPLIEFFVLEEIEFSKPDENAAHRIEDGYDFLVNVFWTAEDRQEEIQRVARAAFGPIGAFVGASLKLGDNGSQKPSPSKNGSKQPVQQSKTPSPTGDPGKSKQPVTNVPSVPSVSNREHGSSI